MTVSTSWLVTVSLAIWCYGWTKDPQQVASRYLETWKSLSISGDGQHILSRYGDSSSSWSLVYDLYADKLLQLNFIPDNVSSRLTSRHLSSRLSRYTKLRQITIQPFFNRQLVGDTFTLTLLLNIEIFPFPVMPYGLPLDSITWNHTNAGSFVDYDSPCISLMERSVSLDTVCRCGCIEPCSPRWID